MATTSGKSISGTSELSSDSFLESIKPSKNKKKCQIVNYSSSDKSGCLSLGVLKSQLLQKKVDKRLRELDQSSHCQRKEKFKSMKVATLRFRSSIKYIGHMKQFWVGLHFNMLTIIPVGSGVLSKYS